MSYPSPYVADELMEQWPYSPNPERVKIAGYPRESIDDDERRNCALHETFKARTFVPFE
jgi:hypothetical protein